MTQLNFKNLVFSALFFWAGSLSAQTFLHADGQNMVDESGQKILLQGVGLGNWMLPEGYMWKFGENGDRPRKIEKGLRPYRYRGDQRYPCR